MKDDTVQLQTKIFSKIINPFLSKNTLSTSKAHLTEKNYCISQCNKQKHTTEQNYYKTNYKNIIYLILLGEIAKEINLACSACICMN